MDIDRQIKKADKHEHPLLTGHYHEAKWVRIWEGALITCLICGRVKE